MNHVFDATCPHGGCAHSSAPGAKAARFAAQLVARPIFKAVAIGLALGSMGFRTLWLSSHRRHAATWQRSLARKFSDAQTAKRFNCIAQT